MKMRHSSPLHGSIRCLTLLLLVVFTSPAAIAAQTSDNKNPTWPKLGWSTFLRGGYVHQFDTDIDNGGSFSVNSLFVQGGAAYTVDNRRGVSLALGYGLDGYDFSGDTGFGSLNPWNQINSFRISTPGRWGLNRQWTLFAVPTLRFTGESGADMGDAVTGGGFVGFSYRFNDRLTIGPGIGVLTQIEDSTSVFPVLIVNWKITDRLSLETGRGLGATLGPGVTLNWKASSEWTLTLGGRFESLRFRLDKNGNYPNGIGQDQSFPLFAGATYDFSQQAQAGLVGGVKLGGEFRLEDENGNRLIEEDYDPAGFVGFIFRFRL